MSWSDITFFYRNFNETEKNGFILGCILFFYIILAVFRVISVDAVCISFLLALMCLILAEGNRLRR